MTPNLLLYQLLLVALVLIYLLIHVGWPDNLSATAKPSLKPDKPRRKRSKDPTPFPGLLHKPLCEACETSAHALPKALGAPPPVLICTRGRRRTVDTAQHFCPEHDCADHGWLAVATSARMGLRAASPGASCSASPATDTFMKPMARSCTASAPR